METIKFTLQVTNNEGRSFNVRLVEKGDSYGLDDCLIHEDQMGLGSMVEFYDATYVNKNGFGPRGQFVSRYYLQTLREGRSHLYGLNLHGGVSEWSLSAENVQTVLRYFIGVF